MGGKKVLCFLAAGLLYQGGVAWAAPAACAGDSTEPRVSAGPYTRTTTDPVTGAAIVLHRDAKGEVSIELTSKGVSVRKTYDGASSTTTLTSAGQHVSISLAGTQMVVTGPGAELRSTAAQGKSLEASAAYLRRSPAAISAKRLLDRAALRPDILEGNALLLTRALLGSMWGESTGTVQYQRWAQTAAAHPKVVKARVFDGPGGCWDDYAREAIRIMDDYVQCGNLCGWSGELCLFACGLIYDLRAEGAFMWYMKCNGGFFVG